MTTLTVTVDNAVNASFLTKMLKALRFVKKIEQEADDYELSSEQIQLLEERLEEYKKNPKKGKSLEQFCSDMKKKYGA